MLGASFDDPAENKAFAEKFGFPYKLLTFDMATGAVWGAVRDNGSSTAKRISYLIGPDRRIVKAYPTVKSADHPAEVLADIPG